MKPNINLIEDIKEEILYAVDGHNAAVAMSAISAALEDIISYSSPSLSKALETTRVITHVVQANLEEFDRQGIAGWSKGAKKQ